MGDVHVHLHINGAEGGQVSVGAAPVVGGASVPPGVIPDEIWVMLLDARRTQDSAPRSQPGEQIRASAYFQGLVAAVVTLTGNDGMEINRALDERIGLGATTALPGVGPMLPPEVDAPGGPRVVTDPEEPMPDPPLSSLGMVDRYRLEHGVEDDGVAEPDDGPPQPGAAAARARSRAAAAQSGMPDETEALATQEVAGS